MNSFAQWLENRTGVCTLWKTMSHWSVPRSRCCCGIIPTMIVFAFIVQVITGLVIWLYYSPSGQTAWESVFYMQYVLPLGWWVRGIHHFSAQVLVGLLGFHVFVILLTGQYRAPREFVFWSTLGLLGFALGCCLTGDLLPWSDAAFSATRTRVSFLNLLPTVGPWLFKLAAGGADFGILSPSRFLVLHIAICGGGFFALLVLWKWFSIRARNAANQSCHSGRSCCCSTESERVPFWSGEVIKQAFGCLLFMALVSLLVFQKPLLDMARNVEPNPEVPFESTVGVHLSSPADVANPYGGARPEWSFRAVYYFANLKIFPTGAQYIPIFIIPSCLAVYFFLVPFIGRMKLGAFFNSFMALVLLGAFAYMTYASYEHDLHDTDHQKTLHESQIKAERMIELALSPNRIPPTGALSLLQNDPKTQGPILYAQHCASCHPFEPLEKVVLLPLDQLPDEFEDQEELDDPALQIYAADGKPVSRAEKLAAKKKAVEDAENADDPENQVKDIIIREEIHPDYPIIKCENPSAPNLYRPLRAEWMVKYFDFDLLQSDDCFGQTMFVAPEELAKKAGDKPEMYAYTRTLPGRMESEELTQKSLRRLIDVLVEESQLDGPRNFVLGSKKATSIDGLDMEDAALFEDFGCLNMCHRFYDIDGLNKEEMRGPDLSGYMSRQWMIDFIKTPELPQFYGSRNDRMPVYYRSETDSLMSEKEIELLVDWLRGHWYRKAPVQELR